MPGGGGVIVKVFFEAPRLPVKRFGSMPGPSVRGPQCKGPGSQRLEGLPDARRRPLGSTNDALLMGAGIAKPSRPGPQAERPRCRRSQIGLPGIYVL